MEMETENWNDMILECADGDEIIACTLTEEELNRKFDSSFGLTNGKPFTAWSENYVYFPVVYDGSESVGRTPRNPCDEATEHQGGE